MKFPLDMFQLDCVKYVARNSFGYTLEFSGPILPISKILQHYHSIYST